MTPDGRPRIRLALIAIAICVASVVVAGSSVVYVVITSRDRAEQAREFAKSTHDALCTFKNDIQIRHDGTKQFLEDLLSGKRPPIPGIATGDLQRSLDTQRQTLESLRELDCTEGASP